MNEFENEKKIIASLVTKKLKNLLKQEAKILKQINACDQWEAIKHEADLLKFNFSSIKKGMIQIEIIDWITDQPRRLLLDPMKSAEEQLKIRYKKAKKLQAGKEPWRKQLTRVLEEKATFENLLNREFDSIEDILKLKESLFLHAKVEKESLPKPSKCYREFISTTGQRLWVGKNAKGNDELTFKLANGRDFWLHVKGFSGSHVILRSDKEIEKPDPESLQDALQLALYYSTARKAGEAEICLTKRKFVSKLSAKPGAVQISKQLHFWIRLDQERLKTIKQI